MPVKVQITMVGLSALLRQDGITYALLPNTKGHEHQHGQEPMPEHVARLFLGPTETDGGFPVGAALPLDHSILRIRGRQSADAKDGPLPGDLFNLFRVTKHTVAPETLAYRPPISRVTARLELALLGDLCSRNPEAYKVTIDGKEEDVVMASYSVWTGTVEDPGPTIELVRLAEDGTSTSLDITPPHAADGSVALSVYHVPRPELPPNTSKPLDEGAEVFHFSAYYVLFDSPESEPLPTVGTGTAGGGSGRGTASGCNQTVVIPHH